MLASISRSYLAFTNSYRGVRTEFNEIQIRLEVHVRALKKPSFPNRCGALNAQLFVTRLNPSFAGAAGYLMPPLRSVRDRREIPHTQWQRKKNRRQGGPWPSEARANAKLPTSKQLELGK